ncbi:MAG: hypothetical protein KDE25_12385 [Novosphingobium sp.]|nr:hypothetical protein [Novosphingobium sp.]
MSAISYCCGYWTIPSNPKHQPDHYKRFLPLTLDMIRGQSLRLYCGDEETQDFFKALCDEREIDFDPQITPIDSLPAWDLAQSFVESCKSMRLDIYPRPSSFHYEKGVTHYWRDYKDGGIATYRSMIAIWLSKIYLCKSLADERESENPVAWIDASLSRHSAIRTHNDISKLTIPDNKLLHYPNRMRFFGSTLPINASYLGAYAHSWNAVCEKFDSCCKRAALLPYAGDEETVLALCHGENPELFEAIPSQFKVTGQFGFKQRVTSAIRTIVGR